MKNKKRTAVVILVLLISISVISVLGISGAYLYVKNNVDYTADEALFASVRGHGATKFYYDASYGEKEYEPKELCEYKGSGVKKQWFSYDDIGENLKKAFICAEDRNFFEHKGVDLKRTAFAVINYFFQMKKKFGGSTITQQVIKNISGDSEQTVKRKISEIFRATHLENTHTKEEIFEVYLNIVPMGDGIIGVGKASDYYFGKSPDDLTYVEAATLVGITNAPARYNPRINPELSLKKRNNVLYAMLECGEITKEDYDVAVASELEIINCQSDDESCDSWFIETVCDDLARDIAKSKGITESAARVIIMNGGLSVYTTVNPKIQDLLESYFENESNFPQAIKSGLNYSMVITDSKNGNLLGIVGSVGKKEGNRLLNHATLPHTPGSALKPIALYAPLINEKKINWATVFDDVPIYFNEKTDGEYTPYPKNYPNVYDGLTTVCRALTVSKNTVAVRLYNLLGKEKIFNSLKKDFGFDLVASEVTKAGTKLTDKAVAPLALGQLTHGISLRDLTQAYTVFPSEGELSFSRSYTKVFDSSGRLMLENESSKKQIYSKDCANIMNMMLMKVTEEGTAKTVTLGNIVDTAGKTGTSGNDLDRVFIGYTPYYTAGIWCGYGKGATSIGRQSISHLEIWDEIMLEVHGMKLKSSESVDGFSVDGLKFLPFCKDSGKRFSENCLYDPRDCRLEYGYFTEDNKPEENCDRHVVCLCDEGFLDSENPSERLSKISFLDIAERSFPIEINITDAEYMLSNIDDRFGNFYDYSHYMYTVEKGAFVGRGKKKKTA